MANKNKIIVTILQILLVSVFLNSCDTIINQAGKEAKQAHENIYIPKKNENEEESLCPICKRARRYFCKLGNGYITLACEDCFSTGLDPSNIGENGIARTK